MSASLPFEKVARALRGCRSVFITVHLRPDGDALGCQLALALMLRRLNIRTYLANEDPVPENYRFLPGARAITTKPGRLPRRFDAAVVLECATLSRAGRLGPLARRARIIVNIDHHLGNSGYGTHNIVDPGAPATVLLAEELRRELGVPLTREMAVNFFVGLYTETGGFRYSNTTPAVLHLASRLMEAGVDPRYVGEQIYERVPLRRFQILARALGTLQFREGISWMSVTRRDLSDFGGTEEDVEDFVEYPRAIKNVKVAAFLRENAAGGVRVSLRTKSDIPVNRIAERFGGGGHAYAAGCTLSRTTLEDARRRLGAAVRAELRRRREGTSGHRRRRRGTGRTRRRRRGGRG